jgi:hypothetical protein
VRTSEKVVLSWIDPGQVDGMFAVCIGELWRHRASRLTGVLRVEGGLISRQRNEVVRSFLDYPGGAEWLFMVDSDEQLTVPTFDKMINTAHALERPVVAGLYFGTWPTHGNLMPMPVPHIYRQGTDGVSVAPVMDYPRDSVIDIDAAGTGALLVHRRVLEAIRDEAGEHEGTDWCWFRDLPVGGKWMGEDMYFCRRIRSLGFPIVAHTGAILAHRRRYWLDERQHEAARMITEERACLSPS